MRNPFLFPVDALRPEGTSHAGEHAADIAGGISPSLSGQRRRPLRHGDPWLDVGFRQIGSEDPAAGALPRGWDRASGTGRADGRHVGPTGGRHPDGSPRFDQPVPSGGYLWWYIDALSDDGNYGLTIIAFVGSVFSPYYRAALKRGAANPENYCSLNVALYGRNPRWTMTERGRDRIARDASSFTIGPSSLHWHRDHLEIDICEIGMPLPLPVRGKVRVYPSSLSTFSTALDDQGRHRWGPLAACARVEVEMDKPSQRWSGHGYFDSNEGDEPVSEPFREWDWSRALLSDGSAAVIYDVQQKQGKDRLLGLRFSPNGHIEEFAPPPRQSLELTRWRIPRRMRSEGDAPVRVIDMLEDTPFYERSVLKSRLFGEDVISVHETLNVPRLVSPVVQYMLPFRMPRRA